MKYLLLLAFIASSLLAKDVVSIEYITDKNIERLEKTKYDISREANDFISKLVKNEYLEDNIDKIYVFIDLTTERINATSLSCLTKYQLLYHVDMPEYENNRISRQFIKVYDKNSSIDFVNHNVIYISFPKSAIDDNLDSLQIKNILFNIFVHETAHTLLKYNEKSAVILQNKFGREVDTNSETVKIIDSYSAYSEELDKRLLKQLSYFFFLATSTNQPFKATDNEMNELLKYYRDDEADYRKVTAFLSSKGNDFFEYVHKRNSVRNNMNIFTNKRGHIDDSIYSNEYVSVLVDVEREYGDLDYYTHTDSIILFVKYLSENSDFTRLEIENFVRFQLLNNIETNIILYVKSEKIHNYIENVSKSIVKRFT